VIPRRLLAALCVGDLLLTYLVWLQLFYDVKHPPTTPWGVLVGLVVFVGWLLLQVLLVALDERDRRARRRMRGE
jgi:4-hydroxybenzoate polyprenyltransferase